MRGSRGCRRQRVLRWRRNRPCGQRRRDRCLRRRHFRPSRGGTRRPWCGHPPVASGATAHDAPTVLHRRHRGRRDPAPLRVGARGCPACRPRRVRASGRARHRFEGHPGHPGGQRGAESHRRAEGQLQLPDGTGLHVRAEPVRGVRRASRRIRRDGQGNQMSDKRTTLDDAIAVVESGMTIGIGGSGARRKPMAFVRALLRTDVTDLTVVTYGGPDLGLLCSAGKVKRVYYGFVSLDSPPFYDPWFAKARTTGAIESREMDEGMLRCGLQAAAQRLPFLPIRAGLGSSVPDFWEGELQTVSSPYPAPEGGFETLIAMPALRLDAAFVHMNLGDAQGNAAYTGIDPYFDDLFLMAADKRFLSVERIVSTEELVKSVPPQALLVNRMMVDVVVEAPGGAHFTTAEPDYGRDEKCQRHYAEAAGSDEGWQQFVATYLAGSEADYQQAVRAFGESVAK